MKLHVLAKINRSIRRFHQEERISRKELLEMIDCARLAPSAANLQMLRFTPIYDRDRCERLFPSLKWAGYLKEWQGPVEGERPAAYIVIQVPGEERAHLPVDAGITAAYIVLAARDMGYGSCMIMSFERDMVRKTSGTPEGYDPLLVIALGKPAEEVVLEEFTGSIEYYRDGNDVHHVPKLKLKDVITGDDP